MTVRHAEVLEPDGSLHTRSLRTAQATDEYIIGERGRDGARAAVHVPRLPLRRGDNDSHGSCGAEVVAISSDLRQRGTFACSDDRLNKLHENVVWSQRGNFVSIPTDCPQRDERLGWTGDAQAFASTACALFESDAFWQSWLRDLELDQDDVLGVPSVVPDVVLGGEARYGRAGWADAATIVPWAVYESYGDPEVLRRQFASMRRWVDSLVRRQAPDGLLRPSWQFGDWLDPDAPSDRPWEAKADGEFIANAFFAEAARLAFRRRRDPRGRPLLVEYGELAARVADATWSGGPTRRSAPRPAAPSRCCSASPLSRTGHRSRRRSRGLVNEADGRVATGFLGTPLVLPAFAEAGRFDEAYRMLLGRSTILAVPGRAGRNDGLGALGRYSARWLHPPRNHGAHSRRARGAEAGSMLSFNHYAYGAVIDWVYRHVAGLAPDVAHPGYAEVVFAPRPATGIDWARASVESPFGKVAIEWRVESDRLTAEVDLPIGTSGTFLPPLTDVSEVQVGDRQAAAGSKIELGPGQHRVTVTQPAVANSAR